MANTCAHCGYERIQDRNSPIAFCQTPGCAGNAWGGTDDGQLDPQPTTVMEMEPISDQPEETYYADQNEQAQSFGDRVIEKAVAKSRDGIQQKVEEVRVEVESVHHDEIEVGQRSQIVNLVGKKIVGVTVFDEKDRVDLHTEDGEQYVLQATSGSDYSEIRITRIT